MMPNNPNDPNCNHKKRFIGNDNVTIVYNDSGKPYNRDTITVSSKLMPFSFGLEPKLDGLVVINFCLTGLVWAILLDF